MGSVLLSCEDSSTYVTPRDNIKNLLSTAQLITSASDCLDINKLQTHISVNMQECTITKPRGKYSK